MSTPKKGQTPLARLLGGEGGPPTPEQIQNAALDYMQQKWGQDPVAGVSKPALGG